ncbi:MAG: VOC family protein [Ilumatobacteraceae bacterium]
MTLLRVMFSPTDFGEAVRFFTEIVELDLVASWDDDGRGAIFQAPGAQIELFGSGPADADHPHRPAQPTGSLDVGVAWEVDDVDATATRIIARGAAMISPPTDRPWGMRSTTIAGPDGLLVTLFQLI